jgi:choline-sulfatase
MNHRVIRFASLLSVPAAVFCVALFGARSQTVAAEDAGRPNILFIFADDQSYETIAAHGFDEVQTPNLDRLARGGTSFSHAYNMGSWSGAVCIASRMMLNSGRTVWRAERVHPQAELERRRGRWWGEAMKAAGYKTYMTGKWHLPADPYRSFDVVRDVRPGMPKDTPSSYRRPPDAGEDEWSPSDASLGGYWEGGTHWSEVVGNHGVDFLALAAVEDRPFFMYLAFNSPHDPRQSPAEYVDRYPVGSIRLPESFLPDYPFADAIGCGPGLRDENLAPFPRSPDAVRTHRQEYFAIITHMDHQIGRILDALAASGKAENTWVFFTADHGLAVGNHGLMGKQNQYDHSVRVPFIVMGPGVKKGHTITEPIYLQDVMPTTLQLAGAGRPDHIEFQDLLPVLDGGPSGYDAIYGSYLDLQRSVRTRSHKLIVYPKAGVVRLYDLENDPQELHDLAGEPSSPAVIDALFAKLLELQDRYGDSLDLSAIGSKLKAKRQ